MSRGQARHATISAAITSSGRNVPRGGGVGRAIAADYTARNAERVYRKLTRGPDALRALGDPGAGGTEGGDTGGGVGVTGAGSGVGPGSGCDGCTGGVEGCDGDGSAGGFT